MGSDSVTIDIPEIAEYTPIKLNVFPNPGTNEINWTSPVEDVEVCIYSTTGVLISRTFESVILTDDWPAGIYVLSPKKREAVRTSCSVGKVRKLTKSIKRSFRLVRLSRLLQPFRFEQEVRALRRLNQVR